MERESSDRISWHATGGPPYLQGLEMSPDTVICLFCWALAAISPVCHHSKLKMARGTEVSHFPSAPGCACSSCVSAAWGTPLPAASLGVPPGLDALWRTGVEIRTTLCAGVYHLLLNREMKLFNRIEFNLLKRNGLVYSERVAYL